MIRTTEHPYIVKNDEILSGEPIIKGTRVPVRAIVETWRMGVPPEAIPQSFPHITVAQVFDALRRLPKRDRQRIVYAAARWRSSSRARMVRRSER